MPRQKSNPFPEGSAEYEERAALLAQERADREAQPKGAPATERNITVRVSIEAINAAKGLATLAGLPYREVLAAAAQAGVESLTAKVRAALAHDPSQDMPF